MKKLIIHYPDDVDPAAAAEMVIMVIQAGKASRSRIAGYPVDHYCWATTFNNGYAVLTHHKKRINGPDVFTVEQVP